MKTAHSEVRNRALRRAKPRTLECPPTNTQQIHNHPPPIKARTWRRGTELFLLWVEKKDHRLFPFLSPLILRPPKKKTRRVPPRLGGKGGCRLCLENSASPP